MPYITQERRQALAAGKDPHGAGELNYQITQLCLAYLARVGVEYKTLNEVIGVLECAKLEMYRRKVSAYEDGKIAANGDVY